MSTQGCGKCPACTGAPVQEAPRGAVDKSRLMSLLHVAGVAILREATMLPRLARGRSLLFHDVSFNFVKQLMRQLPTHSWPEPDTRDMAEKWLAEVEAIEKEGEARK